MIAEIHSKISSSGSNISDRAEDQLTGNVFGSLRYLPVELGLKPLLKQAVFETPVANDFQADLDEIPTGEWSTGCLFWPRHPEGEIDLLFQFPKCIIGIEVKYHSDLSSDDAVDNSNPDILELQESKNQLAREIRIVDSHCRESDVHRRGWLILLAKQGEPEAIVQSARERNILIGDAKVGVLSWTSVLEALEAVMMETLDRYQRLILSDLVRLLRKRGFERFRDFSIKETASKPVSLVDPKIYFDFPVAAVPFSFEPTLNVHPNEYFRA
jgi:hypothetical protein